jgi:hypothetical protein
VPCFVNYKKGALDSQLQVIKFTSFVLEYRLSKATSWNTSYPNWTGLEEDPQYFELSGLSSGSVYDIQMYARNTVGNSLKTNIISVSTTIISVPTTTTTPTPGTTIISVPTTTISVPTTTISVPITATTTKDKNISAHVPGLVHAFCELLENPL